MFLTFEKAENMHKVKGICIFSAFNNWGYGVIL